MRRCAGGAVAGAISAEVDPLELVDFDKDRRAAGILVADERPLFDPLARGVDTEGPSAGLFSNDLRGPPRTISTLSRGSTDGEALGVVSSRSNGDRSREALSSSTFGDFLLRGLGDGFWLEGARDWFSLTDEAVARGGVGAGRGLMSDFVNVGMGAASG